MNTSPGELRIIGGRWKRSKLTVLDKEGLRPTSDRVRETLFNWLMPCIEGSRVLDAFAGTGALGFEAASRGAAQVVCVEQDADLVRLMRQAQSRLQDSGMVNVEQSDALVYLRRLAPHSFDLVLLDPPFSQGLHAVAIAAAQPVVAPMGWLYVEAKTKLPAPEGWTPWRHLKAGQVHAHLWRKG